MKRSLQLVARTLCPGSSLTTTTVSPWSTRPLTCASSLSLACQAYVMLVDKIVHVAAKDVFGKFRMYISYPASLMIAASQITQRQMHAHATR